MLEGRGYPLEIVPASIPSASSLSPGVIDGRGWNTGMCASARGLLHTFKGNLWIGFLGGSCVARNRLKV